MEKFTINFRKKARKGKKKIVIKSLDKIFPNLQAAEKFAPRLLEKFGAYDFTIWQDGKKVA